MALSFSRRLLLMFILSSVLPLFLLSGVFAQIGRTIVEKNARRLQAQATADVSQSIAREIQSARAFAEELACRADVLSWCAGTMAGESEFISDLFQFIAKNQPNGSEVYVISDNKHKTISRSSVPSEYADGIFRDWGVLHKARTEGGTVLFSHPHKNGAAVAIAVHAGDAGIVIVDILRERFAALFSPIAQKGSFTDFFVYDESGCIAFSPYVPNAEGLFVFDEMASRLHGKKSIAAKILDTPFTAESFCAENSGANYTKDLLLMAIFTAAIASLFALLFSAFVSRQIAEPVQNLARSFEKAESGDLSVQCEKPKGSLATEDMVSLIERFNKMVQKIALLTESRVEQERLLRVSEIKNLQAQISPHFLYNTLNSIKAMAKLKGEKGIAKMVTSLGSLLHDGFSPQEDSCVDFCSIEKSLELIHHYFYIETMRWQDKFSFEEHINPDILPYPIPRLVLQPIVENALVHGLEEKSTHGTLTIRGDFETLANGKTDIVLQVIDDGVGMSEAVLRAIKENRREALSTSSGIAISNTSRRLKLLYGESYALKIASKKGEGTSVTIRLPKGEKNDKSAYCGR